MSIEKRNHRPNDGPFLAADAIIELPDSKIVFIERRNEPHGWAIPGGFVDYGESLETAARREAAEETGLDVEIGPLLYTYSDPSRDPRHHTVTAVFIARAEGTPVGGDDAARAVAAPPDSPPGPLAFDHPTVLEHYREFLRSGRRPGDW